MTRYCSVTPSHSAGGKTRRQFSGEIVTTEPPGSCSRNLAGRANRPLASRLRLCLPRNIRSFPSLLVKPQGRKVGTHPGRDVGGIGESPLFTTCYHFAGNRSTGPSKCPY